MRAATRLFFSAAVPLLAAACGGGAPAPPDSATPLLWSVEGPAGRGWLYGTMHVSTARALALPPAVAAALEESDETITEVAGGLAASLALFEAGSLPPGESLRERLPQPLHRRLVAYLEERRLGSAEFERFRPWLATLMLGQLDAQPLLTGPQPLDEHLRARAAAAGKRVGELESVAEQLAALAGGSAEDQVRLLDVALSQLEQDRLRGRVRIRELYDAWLRGDEKLLLRLAHEGMDLSDPAQSRWWDAVHARRNARMAERADARLRAAGGRPLFFAVGALHLVGEGSVVALLRERGWTVTRRLE